MRSSLFLGLVKILVFILTLLSTRCSTLPVQKQGQGNDINSRPTRSIHALQQRLCPEGTGSKNCFYSQLSMFMQMREPLRNLANSRVIGKRAMSTMDYGPTPTSLFQNRRTNDLTDDAMAIFRNVFADSADGQEDVFDPNMSVESPDYDLVNTEDMFDPIGDEKEGVILNILADAGIHIDSFNQYMNERLNDLLQDDIGNSDKMAERFDNTNGFRNDEIQYLPLKKRQLVCPPGKTKLNCYNDAFSYYMHLLHKVGDQ